MVEAYWNVGQMIVEEEQRGQERAEYGAALLKNLSIRLTAEFGARFDERELRRMRQFSLFSIPGGALRPGIGMDSLPASDPSGQARRPRMVFERSRRTELEHPALERQISSLYYERLLMSRKKARVIEEMHDKTAPSKSRRRTSSKTPYVLEFRHPGPRTNSARRNLEQAIIGKLKPSCWNWARASPFVARQRRISTETKDFFVDLVFYNYILKCFVLVDLKTGELTHQDYRPDGHVCPPVRGHRERRG